MDDEVKGKGNSINYKYRMHDPRIGRFFAVDPLAPKYPQWGPYNFSGNIVINSIELEGLEPIGAMLGFVRWIGGGEAKLKKTSAGRYMNRVVELYNGEAITDGLVDQMKYEYDNPGEVMETKLYDALSLGMYSDYQSSKQLVENAWSGDEAAQVDLTFMMISALAGTKNFKATMSSPVRGKSPQFTPKLRKRSNKKLGRKRVTKRRINKIKKHFEDNINTLDGDTPKGGWDNNKIMLERLEKIRKGELEATMTDKRFMSHELSEQKFMKKGMAYKQAHNKSMRKWQTNETEHYTTEANEAWDNQLRRLSEERNP